MFISIINVFINETEEGEYLLTTVGYLGLAVLMLLFLFAIAVFGTNSKKLKTKQLVFAAVSIALAMVTSFIKFGSLPFGGSITLFSMFFICYLGYLYGIKVGLMTGIAYGILQLIVEPYIFHPLQVLLDFPLAFGCLGLAGIFSTGKKKSGQYNLIYGYLIATLGLYVCHVISGYIFFRNYAPKGWNPMLYTFTYNASYIFPEAIATVVILFIPSIRKALFEVKKMANQN
jgi:thiamine transporter